MLLRFEWVCFGLLLFLKGFVVVFICHETKINLPKSTVKIDSEQINYV